MTTYRFVPVRRSHSLVGSLLWMTLMLTVVWPVQLVWFVVKWTLLMVAAGCVALYKLIQREAAIYQAEARR